MERHSRIWRTGGGRDWRAAAEQEFKFRFWIFGGIYWLSFLLYVFDPRNAGFALGQAIAKLRHSALGRSDVHAVFFAAALLALLAAVLRTWATGYLRPEIVVDGTVHSSRLVADGPYRFVRNPLYLGNMLLAVAFATMASRLGAVVLVAGHALFLPRLIAREEQALTAGHREAYAAYFRSVPKLVPALSPRVAASGHRSSLSAGLLGEGFFWGMALSVTVFAVTASLKWFYATLALAFAVYFACLPVIKKRRRRTPEFPEV
jgi:protein-S-isoprenylcysteine O-methyltransferase Ste14